MGGGGEGVQRCLCFDGLSVCGSNFDHFDEEDIGFSLRLRFSRRLERLKEHETHGKTENHENKERDNKKHGHLDTQTKQWSNKLDCCRPFCCPEFGAARRSPGCAVYSTVLNRLNPPSLEPNTKTTVSSDLSTTCGPQTLGWEALFSKTTAVACHHMLGISFPKLTTVWHILVQVVPGGGGDTHIH